MKKITFSEAKIKLLTDTGDICQQFFIENNNVLELAYYELLHKNCIDAEYLFQSIEDGNIRAKWGTFIAPLCRGYLSKYPTYIEIRSFFEIDIQLLLNYYLGDYVEEICKYMDILYTINPEIYKYMGRVFIKNNYLELGIAYLRQGKDKFYNDPELHYLIAEYYYNLKDYRKALVYIEKCLDILPEYFPARKMYEMLLNQNK